MQRLTLRGLRVAAALGAVVVTAMVGVQLARADDAADRLAAHVGQTLDLVELGTGRRFVRPTLVGLVEKGGRTTALRLRPEGVRTTTTVSRAGIVKVVAGRETVFEASEGGSSWQSLRARRAGGTAAEQAAESAERMKAHGIEPWPRLSSAEHAAEVASLRQFVEKVRAVFPGLEVSETHEFLVASDIPAEQLAPYVANLDAMHDFLCDLYGIPRGEPVWKGKCLVVAFLRETDYRDFEARFMRTDSGNTHGMCHQRSDGRVVTACHRGPDPSAFAHMLVHETSHGFNHRWISPQRIPNWLNEGIAEWVGDRVVKGSGQVPLKERRALAVMQSQRTLGPRFFTADNIQSDQYGMASGLVRLLIGRDPGKFAAFVRGIKEGSEPEASLHDAFGGTFDDLVRAYGVAVGVPELSRGAD